MMVDKTCDYRVLFSKWWIAEWKTIVFPNQVTTCPLQTLCSACDLLKLASLQVHSYCKTNEIYQAPHMTSDKLMKHNMYTCHVKSITCKF